MQSKKFMPLSIALLLFIILSACSTVSENETSLDIEKMISEKKEALKPFDPEPDPNAKQISSYNTERMDDQKEMDENIKSEYEEGNYTLDDPYINVDPYNASPLSALVMFETEDPVSITVTTGNKENEVPVKNSWKKEKKTHMIPVLGLYPGEDNEVKIEATNEEGKTEEKILTITTEDLPDDFMETTLIEAKKEDMETGLTYIIPTSGYLYAVDSNAEVRWYSSLRSRLIFTRLKNGNYLQTTRKDDETQYNELLELDMLGKMHNAYSINIEAYDEEKNNLIHHEVIEMPNDNLLATTHEPNSDYEEDFMSEIDRETGETTQEVNLREAMPESAPDDYDGKNAEDNDWIHQNAIWFDEKDHSILVSGRSQDVILKLSYPDGKLKWILGADEKWPDEFKKYLLEPKGDVKFPAGQHAMKIVNTEESAKNSHIKDVILFDNNEVFTRGNEEESEQYSQAIRYRVNEEDNTVEEIWSYGKERGESFFSHIIGNVQYLYEKDNIILNSGATKDEESPTGITGRIVEVDALTDNKDPIFELEVRGKEEGAVKYVYRTWRLPLYPETEWEFEL